MFSNKDDFKEKYLNSFKEITGETMEEGNTYDRYVVLASLIMRNVKQYMAESHSMMNRKNNEKRVYYFSMEFLIGKFLSMNLMKLGIFDIVKEGLDELGVSLENLEKIEKDAGLGNGGLGRLAACFMESLAFLKIPALGMGIRYRYGLFEQKIVDGNQVEIPDKWLKNNYQWELKKTSKSEIIKFYGRIKTENVDGKLQFIHEDFEPVTAIPYDIPIIGYGTKDVNLLRLWSAETIDDFDLGSFNSGNYLNAVKNKANAEAITHVLYPNDSNYNGRLLRLKQQYFFVSAGLKSIIRRFKKNNKDLNNLEKKIQIQINDTHPALVIPELMRILLDEENIGWNIAWNKVTEICSYTNHTIMPEALETWPIDMVKNLLPRVFMIIEEINRRFVNEDDRRNLEIRRNNSIIKDGVIKMANLAIVGSKSVNGVAKLHSEILVKDTFREMNFLFPHKFTSVTNGVDHRRFLMHANKDLSDLISSKIGDDWIYDGERLRDLLEYEDDKDLLENLYQVKLNNKKRLAKYIKDTMDINVDENSIFDIHVKRIHEYKRQILNVLNIIYIYRRIKYENKPIYPRTFIFAGKAAPGYYMAKKVIKLINSLAEKVNNDKDTNKYLKVIFLENFNVSLAELIYPAADVSEQISTASKEASGTGNMKFMMNGALTLGTLDGANIEIDKLVGRDNIFIFGLESDQVIDYYNNGGYNSHELYMGNSAIKTIVNCLVDGFFQDDPGEFQAIFDSLVMHNDQYFVLKDFHEYINSQKKVETKYKDKEGWFKSSLINIATSGYFYSDRSIDEYNKKIWKIKRKGVY